MKAFVFDLFWTLIKPELQTDKPTENKIVGLSVQEWFEISEDHRVADDRYLGKDRNELEMIRKIVKLLPFEVPEEKIPLILEARYERIRDAIINVKPEILSTLRKLKTAGYKLAIISNADTIDIHYWHQSPLKELFDEVIFSCDAGIIKTDEKIYRLAAEKLGISTNECFYIGDGGSNELEGARKSGMKTILTEYFSVKDEPRRTKIKNDADYIISDFKNLMEFI